MAASAAELNESYRRAALALAALASERRGRALVVTSARRGEGTTTTLLAVAERLRQDHVLRPLIVELPRARPVLAGMFGLDETLTIEDALTGRRTPHECVQTTGDGLCIIPAGGASAGAAAASLPGLVQTLSVDFDLVLIDAPPLLEHTESMIIAAAVRDVVLVVQAGRTRSEVLQRVRRDLDAQGVRIVAAILNRQKRFLPGWMYRWLAR
jgi:Mrp family chromosome partitioning ATPase